jgi:hypothetical protein
MSSFSEDVRRAWAHVPFDEAGDLSYKAFLNSLDREAGLAIEIRRMATTFMREVDEWDFRQAAFFEIRYEDLIADEAPIFTGLFRHYGFSEEAVGRCLDLAEACSFRSRAKRELGTIDGQSHMRSGLSGQWREELGEDHLSLFKSLCGDVLIRLGYERDMNW